VRLIVCQDEPIGEIAAEPETLKRFAGLLDRIRRHPAAPAGRRPAGGRGLLALPLVPDSGIPPLTVLLRPYSTAPMGDTA
jgi:hypothetical protein